MGTSAGPCVTVATRRTGHAAAICAAAASCASISAALNAGFAIFSTPSTLPPSASRKLLSCWLPSGCACTVRPSKAATRSA
jgi:hypothetical protein